MRKVDPAAYFVAVRQEVVPESLHSPIAAVDRFAIEEFVGNVIREISPNRAFLVRAYDPPPRDDRLPIWREKNADKIHEPLQVWVCPKYTRYRSAYRKGRPDDNIDGKVIHHILNRRMAIVQEFGFVRLAPVQRSTNSSSSLGENWGLKLYSDPDYLARHRARGFRIKYAGTDEILVMMDVLLGGGVMEVARIAQNLFEVPGVRAPQASG